jgi:hypothetical protein
MKKIRISLTIKLFNWVEYIAREKDGSLYGYKCEPYYDRHYRQRYGWIPSSLISLCQCFASGNIVPCYNWKESLIYVGDKDRKQRFVFDIYVPDDSKYIYMSDRGSVFVSKTKPYIRKKNDYWVSGEGLRCVLHTRQKCEEWRTSLCEIDKCNEV